MFIRKEEVFLKKRRNTALFTHIMRAMLCALGAFFILNFARADDILPNPAMCTIDNFGQNGGNVTLVAQWTPATYNVTYMDGGVAMSGINPATYTYGTGASVNAQPTKTHGSFDSWCTDAELQTCALPQTITTTDTKGLSLCF